MVAELEALVDSEPLRERLRAQLMLALYRAGRQAEALEAYRAARRTLLAELGIEPGPSLRIDPRGFAPIGGLAHAWVDRERSRGAPDIEWLVVQLGQARGDAPSESTV